MVDVQTSLRMPEELRDRLAKAAEENGRGIGEEMRRRLEASFRPAPATDDPKTTNLLRLVAQLADHVGLTCERPWHEDPFAAAVARVGLGLLIRPVEGDVKPLPDTLVPMLYGPDAKPEEVARGIVATLLAEDRKENPK